MIINVITIALGIMVYKVLSHYMGIYLIRYIKWLSRHEDWRHKLPDRQLFGYRLVVTVGGCVCIKNRNNKTVLHVFNSATWERIKP